MPAANMAKVSSPAIGRSASAACAAVSMVVTPCSWRAAAVVTMMKKADQIGRHHADPGIRGDMPEMCLGAIAEAVGAYLLLMAEARLLSFLRGLPEEQIGADRRPEHRHDGEKD